MKRWKKTWIPMVAVAMLSTGLAGCGSATTAASTPAKKDFVIGFDNGYIGNTWRAQYVADAKQEAAKLKKQGVISRLIIENTDDNVATQLSQLNSMINEGVNALMIDPVSPTSLGPIISRALAKHILVVITNDPAAYANTYAVVGNNYAFWKIEAKWIALQLHGKGNIVEITGLPGNTADTLRIDAANAVLSHYPNIHVLASVPGKWDPAVAESDMSTLLSTYKNINGVLEQDVMAGGVIQAYKAAGRPLPIMTGDYTFHFLREWADTYPSLDSIGVDYQPGIVTDALKITVQLLEGKHFKPGVLQGNPINPSLKNAVLVNPAYVVTKHAEPNAPWMQGIKDSKAISLKEAVALGQGKPAGDSLDGWLSNAEVNALFKK